ncbi:MAG: PIN domain-containing protein [Candidatus Aenigmarchaeota archaeon]|nr:PIN domain-containing protein [Candidatus Aenigmarchaeota archaeon]
MKSKTERKLIKRESNKPKHHIDTCVIIESIKETKLGNVCRKYFNLIGYKYRGYFSLPVVGEYFIKVITDIKEFIKQEQMFEYFRDLIRDKKIKFHVLKNVSLKIRVKELDARINSTDSSILACAIEDNSILVTLDNDLLHNKKIEEQYKVKIKHPKELV